MKGAIRRRLLGIKIIDQTETVVVIRVPAWIGEEGAQKVVKNLCDEVKALGWDVKVEHFGRFVRVERSAPSSDHD